MRARIGAAVIGCGMVGPTHVEAFRLDDRVDLRWICDADPARLERAHAPRKTRHLQEVLADPDVHIVSVATPPFDHLPTTLAALEAGKHVILEKPLSRSPAEIEALVDAERRARARGQWTSGVFQQRFSPLGRRLRELCALGEFGRIESAELEFRCRRTEEYYAADPWRGRWDGEGGAVLLTQAIHSLDLAFGFAGPPVSVTARVERRRLRTIEAEDYVDAEYELAGDVRCRARVVNEVRDDWHIDLRIRGSRGSFGINWGDQLIEWHHPSRALTAEIMAMSGATLEGVKLPGKAEYGDTHALQFADFVSAVAHGRPPSVSFESAGLTAHAVLATYQSAAWGGARVSIPFRGEYSPPELGERTALDAERGQRA